MAVDDTGRVWTVVEVVDWGAPTTAEAVQRTNERVRIEVWQVGVAVVSGGRKGKASGAFWLTPYGVVNSKGGDSGGVYGVRSTLCVLRCKRGGCLRCEVWKWAAVANQSRECPPRQGPWSMGG